MVAAGVVGLAVGATGAGFVNVLRCLPVGGVAGLRRDAAGAIRGRVADSAGGGATGAGVDLEHGHADRAGYADRVCLLHVSVVCRWTSVLRHLGADHRVRGVGPPSRGQSNRKSVRGDQQAAGAGRQGSHAACRRPRAPGAGRSGPSRRPGAGAARREDPGRR
ncbi:Uncharacterised protein [Mycobacterium tuberculosis]|nr:Uncharacterised protein [Mycobacterium tuberculosis]